jgi:hypothetical protein
VGSHHAKPRRLHNLHEAWQRRGRAHAGIPLIYLDNRRGNDIVTRDVVRALQSLIDTGLPLENELYTLIQWQYG